MGANVEVATGYLNSFIVFTTGGYHPLMGMLAMMQIIDVLMGISKAFYFKELSSRKMRRGISRKGVQWLIVVVAHIVDMILFEGTNSIMLIVLIAYIANEGLSIVENAGAMDVLVPDELKRRLTQVQERVEIEEDKLEDEEVR
ncbi:holin family protein [Ruoffia sp. FAM 24228]|uniref:phage holin family protein n=1 Tax=Ruoffia sp. FAM 24228 TaxID=3259517 RepID=UPI0038842161